MAKSSRHRTSQVQAQISHYYQHLDTPIRRHIERRNKDKLIVSHQLPQEEEPEDKDS